MDKQRRMLVPSTRRRTVPYLRNFRAVIAFPASCYVSDICVHILRCHEDDTRSRTATRSTGRCDRRPAHGSRRREKVRRHNTSLRRIHHADRHGYLHPLLSRIPVLIMRSSCVMGDTLSRVHLPHHLPVPEQVTAQRGVFDTAPTSN